MSSLDEEEPIYALGRAFPRALMRKAMLGSLLLSGIILGANIFDVGMGIYLRGYVHTRTAIGNAYDYLAIVFVGYFVLTLWKCLMGEVAIGPLLRRREIGIWLLLCGAALGCILQSIVLIA